MNTTEDRPIVLLGQEPAARELVANPNPNDLVRVGFNSGASLDQIAQYMQLQREWRADEARIAYNKAFAAMKAEAIVIIKNRTVTQGPLSGGKYAELFSVVNAVTPALSKHGLSASWRLSKDDRDWIEVTCTLKHAEGHFETVSMGGPPDVGGAKSALQARASTKTFLERYTLKAILGVAEQGDDTDGNTAKAGASEKDDETLQEGRDASMEGTKHLTAWWGSLTAKQRGSWSKEFAAMRKVAAVSDEHGSRE